MFSSCARLSVSEGFSPSPAWHFEQPLPITFPWSLVRIEIHWNDGLVQKSFDMLILPSGFPPAFATGSNGIRVEVTDPNGVMLNGYPLDPAFKVPAGGAGASQVSVNPFGSISATNVQTALEQVFDPRVIPDWLLGVNAHLGDQRPLDVLREGHVAEVMSAVEAERTGSFA